jgi:fructose 1,6-bisphosphatase
MKLIEKMAKDHRSSWIYGNVLEPVTDLVIDEAYEADFRKAREMAAELNRYNASLYRGSAKEMIFRTTAEVIEKLGEEEIDRT